MKTHDQQPVQLTAPMQGEPGFRDSISAKLRELGHLKTNWDGYGAPPIDPEIIDAAVRFVRTLPDALANPPRVVPMSTGALQLEWHAGPKILELEFESPETIHYLQWHPPTGLEVEDSFPAKDIAKGASLIRWFMTGTGV